MLNTHKSFGSQMKANPLLKYISRCLRINSSTTTQQRWYDVPCCGFATQYLDTFVKQMASLLRHHCYRVAQHISNSVICCQPWSRQELNSYRSKWMWTMTMILNSEHRTPTGWNNSWDYRILIRLTHISTAIQHLHLWREMRFNLMLTTCSGCVVLWKVIHRR